MCGRYFFSDETKKSIADDFGIPKDAIHIDRTGDITPGMNPIVLTNENNHITAENMTWGYRSKDGKLLINARSETVTSRVLFSNDIKRHRCIIPASHFFEWDKDHNKISFFRNDNSAIYLAGFYTPVENRFIIITKPANSSIIKYHDRMPLMMEREDVLPWLTDDPKLETFLAKNMPLLKNNQEFEQLSLF